MTCGDGGAPDFDQVVGILERRARLELRRWSGLGASLASSRITRKGRIGDDELRERVTRLRRAVEDLAARAGDVLGETGIDEAWDALVFGRLSTLPEPSVEARLEDAWAALRESAANAEAIVEREAEPLGECMHLLTPEELEVLSEAEVEAGRDPAPLRRLACMVRLLDEVRRAASEAREIISGRWHRPRQRGRPEQLRGRRLAACLLGAAEGLGLLPSRNREPAKGRPGRSAADAVVAALRRCADMEDPVAKAILKECPEGYTAVEGRLIPACVAGPNGDPLLIDEHQHGKRRVIHWA